MIPNIVSATPSYLFPVTYFSDISTMMFNSYLNMFKSEF